MRRKKESEYGKQLKEKQELKKIYGLREHALHRYVETAQKAGGNPANNLVVLLERRLDSIVYRAGLARTMKQARQFATHGLFMLNDRRVDIPSILVNAGDLIKPRRKELFGEAVKPSVSWLDIDSNLNIKILSLPRAEEIVLPLNINVALQFYSR